jgi:4a-hydroxytetrahydrobiopterin dehydratase
MTHTPAWSVVANKEITRTFELPDFKAAIALVNQIAELAESEGHHPDLNLHSWNKLTVTLSTHAIGGLSQNDFILAAKIDALPSSKL